jgi:hypothetical protein
MRAILWGLNGRTTWQSPVVPTKQCWTSSPYLLFELDRALYAYFPLNGVFRFSNGGRMLTTFPTTRNKHQNRFVFVAPPLSISSSEGTRIKADHSRGFFSQCLLRIA